MPKKTKAQLAYEEARQDCTKFDTELFKSLWLLQDYCQWRVKECKSLKSRVRYQFIVYDCTALMRQLPIVSDKEMKEYHPWDEPCYKKVSSIRDDVFNQLDSVHNDGLHVFYGTLLERIEMIQNTLFEAESDDPFPEMGTFTMETMFGD